MPSGEIGRRTDSKSSGSDTMSVRVRPSAPEESRVSRFCEILFLYFESIGHRLVTLVFCHTAKILSVD